MASVNKVILVGNLTRDPEVRMTPGGAKVASFSIATNEKFIDKQDVKQEKVEYHNIVAWNRLAEIIEQYVKKGSSVYIEGKLTTRSWDDDQGNKKYRTEVIANQLQMLGGRNDYQGGGQSGGGYQAQGNQAPQGGGGYQQSQPAQSNSGGYQQPAQGGNQAPQQAANYSSGPADEDLPF